VSAAPNDYVIKRNIVTRIKENPCYIQRNPEYQACTDYDPCLDFSNMFYYLGNDSQCTKCNDVKYLDPNFRCCYDNKGNRTQCQINYLQ
jgi:hypothetical protein